MFDSYITAYRKLKTDEDRSKLATAIFDYGLDEQLPDLPFPLDMLFDVIKPNIDASHRKAEAGAKGGSSRSKKQAKGIPEAGFIKSGSNQNQKQKTEMESKNEKEFSQEEKLKLINSVLVDFEPVPSPDEREILVRRALGEPKIWGSGISNRKSYLKTCITSWRSEAEAQVRQDELEVARNKRNLRTDLED